MSISFNRVILAGHITREPEVRYASSGIPIARIGLAVNSKRKQGDTYVEEVLFIDGVAFGRTAETLGEYVHKGDPVLLEGRLSFSTWEDKNGGGKRSKHEVLIDRFQMLKTRDAHENDRSTSYKDAQSDDEVPF